MHRLSHGRACGIQLCHSPLPPWVEGCRSEDPRRSFRLGMYIFSASRGELTIRKGRRCRIEWHGYEYLNLSANPHQPDADNISKPTDKSRKEKFIPFFSRPEDTNPGRRLFPITVIQHPILPPQELLQIRIILNTPIKSLYFPIRSRYP